MLQPSHSRRRGAPKIRLLTESFMASALPAQQHAVSTYVRTKCSSSSLQKPASKGWLTSNAATNLQVLLYQYRKGTT